MSTLSKMLKFTYVVFEICQTTLASMRFSNFNCTERHELDEALKNEPHNNSIYYRCTTEGKICNIAK